MEFSAAGADGKILASLPCARPSEPLWCWETVPAVRRRTVNVIIVPSRKHTHTRWPGTLGTRTQGVLCVFVCVCVCAAEIAANENPLERLVDTLLVFVMKREAKRERERVWSLFVGMICIVMKTKDFVKTFELRVCFSNAMFVQKDVIAQPKANRICNRVFVFVCCCFSPLSRFVFDNKEKLFQSSTS